MAFSTVRCSKKCNRTAIVLQVNSSPRALFRHSRAVGERSMAPVLSLKVGYIYVTKDVVRKEYNVRKITKATQ